MPLHWDDKLDPLVFELGVVYLLKMQFKQFIDAGVEMLIHSVCSFPVNDGDCGDCNDCNDKGGVLEEIVKYGFDRVEVVHGTVDRHQQVGEHVWIENVLGGIHRVGISVFRISFADIKIDLVNYCYKVLSFYNFT